MKINAKSISKGALVLLLSFTVFSCMDLTETNDNPNTLTAEKIDPPFVMTEILTTSARHNVRMHYGSGVGTAMLQEAMQYLQRDFLEYEVVNTFAWFPQTWASDYYKPIANAVYLQQRAVGHPDEAFLKGVAIIMKSYWYGYLTSAWGDIPYSEAMRGEEGILKPVYDPQKEVFKGILAELETANDLLTSATAGAASQSADVLYKGNALKWRQFGNSLRLRFLLRLSEKMTDMQAIGVDVKAEVSKMVTNTTKYPLITQSADNAAISYPGTASTDSWPGGQLNWNDRSEFNRRKTGATLVNFLKDNADPRLTVWIAPVEVPIRIGDKGGDDVILKDTDGKVRRYLKTYSAGIDTALYVGLPIALATPDAYNKNSGASVNTIKGLDATIYTASAANPHVSKPGTIYTQNTNALVKSIFITAAEVNFILAEAVTRTWITGSAVDYYRKGIASSLEQYGIASGEKKVYNLKTHQLDAFDQTAFLAAQEAKFTAATNKLDPILTQSWASMYMTGESWFNWRRTGLPNLGKNIIAGGKGDKIPVRYAYGDAERNFNADNTNSAINTLEPKVNDQWSKMWLIQGTGKPW